MTAIIRSMIICTNNTYAKDTYMAQIHSLVRKLNAGRTTAEAGDFVISYTNITHRNDGGVFSEDIRNPELVFYDIPKVDKAYVSEKVKTAIMVRSIEPYTKN